MSVQYIAKSGKCQKGRYILKTSFCKTRKAIYNTDVVNWHNSYVFCQAEKRNFLGFLCLAAPVPVIPCFTRLVYPACKSGKGSS